MRDAADTVLYVGKAKNLRRRLSSYRVANPDRMPRRHLLMLRAVVRIELQACADERAALARESELLRLLKPRFNRAGTWTAPPRFLAWRRDGEHLHFAVTEKPDADWRTVGPMGVAANYLRNAVVRLLWCALYPRAGICRIPLGWVHGQFADPTTIRAGEMIEKAASLLEKLFYGNPDPFQAWLHTQTSDVIRPFEKLLLELDLESAALALPRGKYTSGSPHR
jgi:hypothetical protein